MRRIRFSTLVGGLCAAGALATLLAGCQDPVPGDREEAPADEATATSAIAGKAAADDYIVVFRHDAPTAAVEASVSSMRGLGSTIRRTFQVIPGVHGHFTPAQLAVVRKDPNVAYVEPNYQVSAATIVNTAQYGLDRIDSRTGTDGKYNDFGFNGAGVHIYILDTGVRTTHHEFTGRIGAGTSTIDGSASIDDCNGHGTNVASIAAGATFGVARGAIIHPVRVLDCTGMGTNADVIEGLDFVRLNAGPVPAVVNMSLFGPQAQAITDAVNAVTAADIPVVVAAGNFNIDACLGSPASTPSAITVGATQHGEGRASFSDFGTCLDLFAPGVQVTGAGNASDTATSTFDGTSQAAPHVTGAVAQFLQRFPRVTAQQVTDGVLNNATANIVGNPGPGSPNRFLFNSFQSPAAKSCFGRCGGQSADFSCGCDAACEVFDDCCTDFGASCPNL